jgi:hypothetical protein
MTAWGSNTASSADAPKNQVIFTANTVAPNTAVGAQPNGQIAFGNTSFGAWGNPGIAQGVIGISNVQKQNTTAGVEFGANVSFHAGWQLRTAGTGPIQSIAIVNPGQGYNTNGFISFTSTFAGVNANASYTVTTNAANALQNVVSAVVINNPGSGYNVAPRANATGTNIASATFAVTLGGRAGRVQYETLVTLNS